MHLRDLQIPAFISPSKAVRIASILLPLHPLPDSPAALSPARKKGKLFLALCLMWVSWQRGEAVSLHTAGEIITNSLLWKTADRLAEPRVFREAFHEGRRVSPLRAAEAEVFAHVLAERVNHQADVSSGVLHELAAAAVTTGLDVDAEAKEAALLGVLAEGPEPSLLSTLLLVKAGDDPTWSLTDLSGPGTGPVAAPADAAHLHQVYSPGAARTQLSRSAPLQVPGEGNMTQARLLHTMAEGTGLKPLRQAPATEVLPGLYTRFPHFGPVLDFVARNLALAGCGTEGRALRIAPMLLRGAPGTGKTYFAQELARLMGIEFLERDLSVSTEAFVLSGMDSAWKNSKPGLVFDALVNGPAANPLILLNEVDKAAATGTHNSAISALYALLEPASARRFVDEFVPVSLDASRINWVLTANDGYIPDPILSRVELFEIPAPTPDQCRQIATSVWMDICEQVLPRGHHFDPVLPASLAIEVGRLSPRVMRKALMAAAGAAAMHGRAELTPDDLNAVRVRYLASSRTPMGFAPTADR